MKNLTFSLLIFILVFSSLLFYKEKVQGQGTILADNQKIYLWFLDSFGGENFLEIYALF